MGFDEEFSPSTGASSVAASFLSSSGGGGMSLTIVGVAIFHQATTAVIPWFIDGERMSCLFWRGVIPPSSKQKGKEFVDDARFTKETRTNLRRFNPRF